MVALQAKTTSRFKNTHDNKSTVAIKMDMGMLNAIIGFCFKKSTIINKKALTNLKRLFDRIDETVYQTNDKLESRFNFIKVAVEGRLEGIDDPNILMDYCRSDNGDANTEEILANVPQYAKLSYDSIRYINNSVADRLQYAFIALKKEQFFELCERLEKGDYKSFKEITKEFADLSKELLNEQRRSSSIEEVNSFSLADENFQDNFKQIVEILRDPARTLMTGIQALNGLLVGGYQSKRLYMYCGLPAGFKSGMLLKTAVDIKKYNKNAPSKKPGLRKTVLFVTLENTVEETIERMFNMTVSTEALKEYTPAQALEMIKKEGSFKIEGDDDINIVVKYFPINSIDTDDLYTIIEDLEDEGFETIALILDYIKRVRPALYAREEKEQLKNVTNELKNLAIELDIPVISAHQLNRSAASTIDSALESNKEDLARFVGRSNIGSAWEVVENSDWLAILNVEKKRGTDDYYLTIKRVKIRYRDPNDISYINHPFGSGNRVQLLDDMHLDQSLSEMSLSSDFEGIDLSSGKKGKRNAIEREVIAGSSDDIFDFGKAINKKKKDKAA